VYVLIPSRPCIQPSLSPAVLYAELFLTQSLRAVGKSAVFKEEIALQGTPEGSMISSIPLISVMK